MYVSVDGRPVVLSKTVWRYFLDLVVIQKKNFQLSVELQLHGNNWSETSN